MSSVDIAELRRAVTLIQRVIDQQTGGMGMRNDTNFLPSPPTNRFDMRAAGNLPSQIDSINGGTRSMSPRNGFHHNSIESPRSRFRANSPTNGGESAAAQIIEQLRMRIQALAEENKMLLNEISKIQRKDDLSAVEEILSVRPEVINRSPSPKVQPFSSLRTVSPRFTSSSPRKPSPPGAF